MKLQTIKPLLISLALASATLIGVAVGTMPAHAGTVAVVTLDGSVLIGAK